MADFITRTLSYWRASWLGEGRRTESLYDILKKALVELDTIVLTRFNRPDNSVIEVRHRFDNSSGAIFLHCVSYVPGAEGSIVPTAVPKSTAGELSTVPPPNDANFLSGSMIAMISGNECLYCGEHIQIQTLSLFIRELFKKINRPNGDGQFEFVNVMDRRLITQINAENVMEIGFNTTLDEYGPDIGLIENQSTDFARRFLSLARGLVESDASLSQLAQDDLKNINAKLSLRLDARVKEGISQEDFDHSAQDVIGDLEPGFYLRLRNGTKITHDNIRLGKTVTIQKRHETIDHAHAWNEMEQYLSHLKATGYA